MSNLGDVCKWASIPKRFTDWGLGAEPLAAGGHGGLGAKPPAAGQFLQDFRKKSYLSSIGSYFARVHSHFNELDF